MKTVIISWKERLDDLYYIADASGLSSEGCEHEWWESWRPDKAGRFDDVEVEPIPKKEYAKFVKYCGEEG